MAHNTLIGGTEYEISGGKTRVSGTNYKIKNGKTKVDGANYAISFGLGAFAECSWEQIIAACQSKNIPSSWKVGDVKPMTIGGKSYDVRIIGMNHDDYADGSGKAPLTLQVDSAYYGDTKYKMNNGASLSKDVNWDNCALRTELLPAYQKTMPSSVNNAIREDTKRSYKSIYETTVSTSDKLFYLSAYEIFSDAEISDTTYIGKSVADGTEYEYYASNGANARFKYGTSTNGSPVKTPWVTRSKRFNSSVTFVCVGTNGDASSAAASAEYYHFPAFCF